MKLEVKKAFFTIIIGVGLIVTAYLYFIKLHILYPIEINDKYGFINKSGNVIVEPQYDVVGEFSEGLAYVCKHYKCGFINNFGKEVIPLKLETASNFSEGLASVEVNNKCEFIDKNGKSTIKTNYDICSNFSEGLAVVGNKNLNPNDAYSAFDKCGYMNKKGEIVIPIKFYYAEPFHEGVATISKSWSEYFFINTKGKIIRELGFDPEREVYERPFSESLALTNKDGKIAYIDHSLNYKILTNYDFTYNEDFAGSSFSEGLAAININGKLGYIDKKGVLVIPAKFDRVLNFREGLAAVWIDNKWGFIDKKGDFVIKPKYVDNDYYYSNDNSSDAFSFNYAPDTTYYKFKNGLAKVHINGHDAYINKASKIVWSQEGSYVNKNE